MKNRSLSIVLHVILLPWFMSACIHSAQQASVIQKFEDIKGLADLSKAFFSKKEYVGAATGTETVLTQEAFDGVVNTFGDRFLQDTNFNNQINWIDNHVVMNPVKLNKSDNMDGNTIRYIQKLKIASNAIVCFMGDFHGSVHSLLRNLWRLVALGYLNEDLTIKKSNFYMVFLGDYVDRGRWGVEVVTTLIKIKLQNWEKVHLLAGNHETGNIPLIYGFYGEIENKFKNTTSFSNVYEKVFMKLPVALFIECNNNFVQCCHGGIEPKVKPLAFLQASNKLFQNVGIETVCAGLFWSDFCAGKIDCKAGARGAGEIVADQKCTSEYLTENQGLKAIMRAHMDMEFGLKLFLDPSKGEACDQKIKTDNYWKVCLYHWTEAAKKLGIHDNKFQLSKFDYYPVFTFTSAVEAREFPFDCFGLVSTAETWDKWMMEVYELFLDVSGAKHRHEKFVHVGLATSDGQTNLVKPSDTQGQDPISVKWESSLNEQRLNDGMAAIVKHGIKPIESPTQQVTSPSQIQSIIPKESQKKLDESGLTKLRGELVKVSGMIKNLQKELNTLKVEVSRKFKK